MFLIFLFIFSLFESFFSTIPFILLALLFIVILKRNYIIFPIAFFAGIFLDLLTFKTVGLSSVFFTIFVFIVLQYQRKFEIESPIFVFLASILGSILFLEIEGYKYILSQSIFVSIVGVLLFVIYQRIKPKDKSINYG